MTDTDGKIKFKNSVTNISWETKITYLQFYTFFGFTKRLRNDYDIGLYTVIQLGRCV